MDLQDWDQTSSIEIEVQYVFSDDKAGSTQLWAVVDGYVGTPRLCKLLGPQGNLLASEYVAFAERGAALLDWVAGCIDRALASDPTVHADTPAAPGLGAASVCVGSVKVVEVAFGRTAKEAWFHTSVQQDPSAFPSLWSMVVEALRSRQRHQLQQASA